MGRGEGEVENDGRGEVGGDGRRRVDCGIGRVVVYREQKVGR